jgi:phospholipase/carboxylesterase
MAEKLFQRFADTKTTAGTRRLLVLLHGLGSNEEDLFSISPYLSPNYAVSSLRAPEPYEGGGFQWFPLNWTPEAIEIGIENALESRELIATTISDLQGEWDFDRDRTVVGGFSQGAIMSLAVALTHPDLVSAAMLLSGAPILPLFPSEIPADIKRIQFLVQHGESDVVIPPELGRATADFLLHAGASPTYREYPMGHEVNSTSMEDAIRWLSQL